MAARSAVEFGLPHGQETLHHALAENGLGHLAVHLAVEPADEAARLGAIQGIEAEQEFFAVGFVEELGDGGGVGQHGAVGLDQHRHLARRIERQKFRAAFPPFLDFQRAVEALLLKDDAQLARKWR